MAKGTGGQVHDNDSVAYWKDDQKQNASTFNCLQMSTQARIERKERECAEISNSHFFHKNNQIFYILNCSQFKNEFID